MPNMLNNYANFYAERLNNNTYNPVEGQYSEFRGNSNKVKNLNNDSMAKEMINRYLQQMYQQPQEQQRAFTSPMMGLSQMQGGNVGQMQGGEQQLEPSQLMQLIQQYNQGGM